MINTDRIASSTEPLVPRDWSGGFLGAGCVPEEHGHLDSQATYQPQKGGETGPTLRG